MEARYLKEQLEGMLDPHARPHRCAVAHAVRELEPLGVLRKDVARHRNVLRRAHLVEVRSRK